MAEASCFTVIGARLIAFFKAAGSIFGTVRKLAKFCEPCQVLSYIRSGNLHCSIRIIADLRSCAYLCIMDNWREQVGQHVEARREQLGLSRRAAAKRAGFSEATWRHFEAGEKKVAPDTIVPASFSARSRVGVCRALMWTDDSVDRLLRGEAAEVLEVTAATELENLRRYVDRLSLQVERLTRASVAMSAAIDSLNARARQAGGQ